MSKKTSFRGRDKRTGEWVYGDVIYASNGTFIWVNIDSAFVPVTPNSISQFVGYDARCEAIYEGDSLIDEMNFSAKCKATLSAEAIYLDGNGSNDIDDKQCRFVLDNKCQ